MDEKEAEARPVMGTIFLVIIQLIAFYIPMLNINVFFAEG